MAVPLAELNALDEMSAARAFLRCCGSSRWAREMAAARPFESAERLHEAADRIWSSLDAADWLEAFAAHPRIGVRASARGRQSALEHEGRDRSVTGERGWGSASLEKRWAAAEQAGVSSAPESVLARLADGNRAYEAKFGYIFIVCATGKSAQEMLALLEDRLSHDPATERCIAADEQAKITHIRLDKL
jgi:OHCU decarboxylase